MEKVVNDCYQWEEFRIKAYTYVWGADLPKKVIKERNLKGVQEKYYKLVYIDEKVFPFLHKQIRKSIRTASYHITDFNNIGVQGDKIFRIVTLFVPETIFEVIKIHVAYEEEFDNLIDLFRANGVEQC